MVVPEMTAKLTTLRATGLMPICAIGLSLIAALVAVTSMADVEAGSDHRVAFVTSVTGTGNLSTWADADGESGLAAGDAVCRARASAAGLANPENFLAWLSDAADDAYCRIHGLSGKKTDNCGQSELPVAAGPWLRPDGFPFSADIGALTDSNPVVFTPLRIDEFGDPVPISAIATGTLDSGVGTSRHCDSWTVGDDDGARLLQGSTSNTGERWTRVNTPTCNGKRRLACFERMAGPDLPPFASTGRPAFVTSVTGPGNLAAWPDADPTASGIEAGDSICQSLADGAGLAEPDTFKAWLSDGATNAIDRFENDGRWVRIDGVPIAAGKAELTDGVLFTGITVTDQGEYLDLSRSWTGTTASGLNAAEYCSGWTNGSDSTDGVWGFPTAADDNWTAWPVASGCDRSHRLYCLSDAVDPVIFADRFEQ